MASDGAVGSTFFEVRLDDVPPEEPRQEKPKGTGGMSFNVDLDETNEEEKTLQLAARLHRIKSEMRRSNIAAQKEKEKIEREALKFEEEQNVLKLGEIETGDRLSLDDLKSSSNASPGTPSEAGTYTLSYFRIYTPSSSESSYNDRDYKSSSYNNRLDSAEVKQRKNLVNITNDSFPDQNSATESTEAMQEPNSTQSNLPGPPQDFEIPSAVSARITEWFNRNEMAESRNSEASNVTDSNLEDIREKAKNRIKEKKELTEKTSSDTLDDLSGITSGTGLSQGTKESKIILSREDRSQKKAENVRSKGSNPQVRLTRAMLLRKNRALGIKPGDEVKEPSPEIPKPAAKPARQISARLDSLSKPKRTSEIGVKGTNIPSRGAPALNKSAAARQRSFSHEDAKVYRGRSIAKPTESSKGPTRKDTNSRSNSLSRSNTKSNISVAKRSKQDVLSQSVRETKSSAPKTQKSQRSTSLTRSTTSTSASLKVKQVRKPNPGLNQSWTGGSGGPNRITSSSSSSRTSRPTSRPATAASVRESHENSILYSLHIISNNCLGKTKEILQDMIGDLSEVNEELEKLNSSGDEGQNLEAIFGRICALDKCLGKIRACQLKKSSDEKPTNEPPKTAPPAPETNDSSGSPEEKSAPSESEINL